MKGSHDEWRRGSFQKVFFSWRKLFSVLSSMTPFCRVRDLREYIKLIPIDNSFSIKQTSANFSWHITCIFKDRGEQLNFPAGKFAVQPS